MTSDLDLLAGTLFRLIEGKAYAFATDQQRQNYHALCRQFIADTRAEQQQPSGQREATQ